MRLSLASALSATVILPGLLSGAGCSSLTVTSGLNNQKLAPDGATVAHLHGTCSGLYLFYYVPLVVGNTSSPGGFTFFRDNNDVTRVVGMVTRRSEELGGTEVRDLQSYTDSWWYSLIFWLRVTVVSGNSMAGATEEPKAPPGKVLEIPAFRAKDGLKP